MSFGISLASLLNLAVVFLSRIALNPLGSLHLLEMVELVDGLLIELAQLRVSVKALLLADK